MPFLGANPTPRKDSSVPRFLPPPVFPEHANQKRLIQPTLTISVLRSNPLTELPGETRLQ